MTHLTHDQARQALAAIDDASRQMRQALRGTVLANVLMLWGVLWALIFGASSLRFPHPDRIAWVLNGFGFLVTGWLCYRQERQVHSPASRKVLLHVSLFQAVIIAYAFALAFLIPQVSWSHRLALLLGIVMLGYVVMGLWLRETVLTVLGLAVTVLLLAGRATLSPAQFLLCLGLGGGGALFTGGLVVRLRWR